VLSVLWLDGEGELLGPGAQSGGGRLAQLVVVGVFLDEAFLAGAADLAVELQALESLGGDVVAGSAVDHPGDTGPIAGGQAHRARLAAGVHNAVLEYVPAEGLACRAQNNRPDGFSPLPAERRPDWRAPAGEES
jgi:hypothetical protein